MFPIVFDGLLLIRCESVFKEGLKQTHVHAVRKSKRVQARHSFVQYEAFVSLLRLATTGISQ